MRQAAARAAYQVDEHLLDPSTLPPSPPHLIPSPTARPPALRRRRPPVFDPNQLALFDDDLEGRRDLPDSAGYPAELTTMHANI